MLILMKKLIMQLLESWMNVSLTFYYMIVISDKNWHMKSKLLVTSIGLRQTYAAIRLLLYPLNVQYLNSDGVDTGYSGADIGMFVMEYPPPPMLVLNIE